MSWGSFMPCSVRLIRAIQVVVSMAFWEAQRPCRLLGHACLCCGPEYDHQLNMPHQSAAARQPYPMKTLRSVGQLKLVDKHLLLVWA